MKLSIKQTTAIDFLEDQKTNVILYGGGAGGGKSMLGVYWILKQALKYPKTRYVIGRSRLKNLKETTLKSFFEVCQMQGLTSNIDFTYNETKSLITIHSSKSEIVLKDLFHYPSDPNFDSLGSLEITGAFIDEAAEVTPMVYNVIQSRMRYNLDENNLIPKLLLTCNPSKGWIYNTFYKLWKENNLPDNQKFVQSLVTDNPNISKHYIEQLKRLDTLNQKRLLYGDWEFSDDDAQLFEFDKLSDLFTNNFIAEGQNYISVDIARYGRDKSVICLWSGLRCFKIITFEKNSIDELANFVIKLATENNVQRSNIIADSDGVGGGFVDLVKGCKSFINNSSALNKENYKNLKTQCYYKFAEMVNNGLIYIKPNKYQNEIIAEFEMVKQHDIDKDNKLAITPKEKIKQLLGRSPDIADALIMRIFFEINKTKVLYFG